MLAGNLFHGHDLIPQLQGANGEWPEATVFATLEKRQGLKVGCPEEVAGAWVGSTTGSWSAWPCP